MRAHVDHQQGKATLHIWIPLLLVFIISAIFVSASLFEKALFWLFRSWSVAFWARSCSRSAQKRVSNIVRFTLQEQRYSNVSKWRKENVKGVHPCWTVMWAIDSFSFNDMSACSALCFLSNCSCLAREAIRSACRLVICKLLKNCARWFTSSIYTHTSSRQNMIMNQTANTQMLICSSGLLVAAMAPKRQQALNPFTAKGHLRTGNKRCQRAWVSRGMWCTYTAPYWHQATCKVIGDAHSLQLETNGIRYAAHEIYHINMA